MTFTFDRVAAAGAARAGAFTTPHGRVETPAFMAVGTLATVKALDPMELEAMGAPDDSRQHLSPAPPPR